MARVFNFSAGPAALPEEVLRQAAGEMLDYQGSGMGVMEMSHRGKAFMAIAAQAQADLRELLSIPPNYKVLFMQGGALGENAIVPLNLLGTRSLADYVNTGHWSTKSIAEASRYAQINVAASSEDRGFTYVPAQSAWNLSGAAAYVHICTNETIGGLEYHWTPDTGDIPLVADVSSNILSKAFDVSKFGVMYGGAQKNSGAAGLTIVIVRDDLLDRAQVACPSAFNYRIVAENDSMYNTPSTYSLYIAGLVFQWLKRQGGVVAMEARNREKAALLYDAIDGSALYENRVARGDRSRMNVTFFLRREELTVTFLAEAEVLGLSQLRGHRAVGGVRASIYNAMPLAGVSALVDHMQDFERRHA
ncbi:MAG: 3-phosphoserine/phosphohydroxythreonine transaminase [Casimicrobiaceae bacterium]